MAVLVCWLYNFVNVYTITYPNYQQVLHTTHDVRKHAVDTLFCWSEPLRYVTWTIATAHAR